MRAIFILAIALLLISQGCIEETSYPGIEKERVENLEKSDLDKDGSPDYLVYDFDSIEREESGKTIKRQITVAVKTRASYLEREEGLSDLDLITANNQLMDFADSNALDISDCERVIGIENVRCIDTTTCKRLCEGTSIECREKTDNFGEVIGGSIMLFQKNAGNFGDDVASARRDILDLKEGSMEKRNLYLNNLRDSLFGLASMNVNPIVANERIQLCNPTDFDMEDFSKASDVFGSYSVENESYTYIVTITVDDEGGRSYLGDSLETISLNEVIPQGILSGSSELSSPHQIVTSDGGGITIGWAPQESSKEAYMMMYSFSSTMPPESVISKYSVPELTVKSANLVYLEPLNELFLSLANLTDNYYLGFGFSLSIIFIIAMMIYTLATLLVAIIRAKMAGQDASAGIRKALGRTSISWKTDLTIAVVLVTIAVFSAIFQAVEPEIPSSMLNMEALEFMISEWWGVIGMICGFFGLLMLYIGLENLVKVMILERTYGVEIQKEKELFETKKKTLLQRLEELKSLIDEASEAGFDVGREYDEYSSVTADKISETAEEMNPRTKKLVSDDLIKIEKTIQKLKQKQVMAEEKWPAWESQISEILSQEGEVFKTSLGGIPASLRPWVMNKYAREQKAAGILFDGRVLKKKEIDPEKLLESFINKGLYAGIIAIRGDEILMAKMSQGSPTVPKVLALKLREYLAGMAKHLGMGEIKSFATLGGKTVVVLMKNEKFDSILFVQKSRFKEAVENWKEQSGMIIR